MPVSYQTGLPEVADVFKQRKQSARKSAVTGPGSATAPMISVRKLPRSTSRSVERVPSKEICADLASELGISKIADLRLAGQLIPSGKNDWRFEGRVSAEVVQPCVVTLDPVTTRIDEPVLRNYVAGWEPPSGDEVELAEDVDIEPLGDQIDLDALMTEALALALPPWPRAEGADLGEAVYTEPGAAPLRDDDLKPFAGLAALRDKLSDNSEES